MSDTFDKSSTLKIDGEVLNRSSFKKTTDEKLARRVSNDAADPLHISTSELVLGVDYDTIDVTYPDNVTEVFTYSLSAVVIQVVTVTYVAPNKNDLLSVVIS